MSEWDWAKVAAVEAGQKSLISQIKDSQSWLKVGESGYTVDPQVTGWITSVNLDEVPILPRVREIAAGFDAANTLDGFIELRHRSHHECQRRYVRRLN